MSSELPFLVRHRQGPAGAADLGLRPPLEKSPCPDRAGLDPNDGQRLRLLDQERERRDVAADAPWATCLDRPAESDECPFEGARKLPGQLERELLPVGLARAAPSSTPSVNTSSSSQIGTARLRMSP